MLKLLALEMISVSCHIQCLYAIKMVIWRLVIKIQNDDELGKVRNSKYAFSNTQSIFCEIKKELNVGKSVLWIGLPCQTAGLKKYLGEDTTKLITVDLICHGVCSVEYGLYTINAY